MTKIRRAVADDAPAISSILSDWIDETAWMPRIHTIEEDHQHGAFLIDKTTVHVAVKEGVEGFIAQRGPVVDSVYVAAGSRRQGVGSLLLNHAKARSDEMELWCFQANENALAFYDSHGFREVERTDGSGNDEKLPDVRLKWTNGAQENA